jgi:hypothetical protein
MVVKNEIQHLVDLMREGDVFWLANGISDAFEVFDFSPAKWLGIYIPTGMRNGRTSYTKQDNPDITAFYCFDPDFMCNTWKIVDESTGDTLFSDNPTEVQYPWQTLWQDLDIVRQANIPLNIPTCKVIYDCDPCLKFSDLADGKHLWVTADPYFYFGNKEEVLRRMTAKDNAPTLEQKYKYPAIILQHTHKEVSFSMMPDKVKIDLLFANIRQPEWTFEQSYQNNIEPILLPLAKKFAAIVESQPNVGAYEWQQPQIMPNYGNGALMASDYWDIIHLPFEILFTNNCKNLTLCQQYQ